MLRYTFSPFLFYTDDMAASFTGDNNRIQFGDAFLYNNSINPWTYRYCRKGHNYYGYELRGIVHHCN